MGRYSFSGHSCITISPQHVQALLDELDFITDEDKTAAENLIDCLSDFSLERVAGQDEDALVFAVEDGDSDDDFDWELLLRLTPYLEEGSFYEERPPELEDKKGRIYYGVLVGTVEKGHLVRRCYEFVTNDQGERERRLIEVFDKDLARN